MGGEAYPRGIIRSVSLTASINGSGIATGDFEGVVNGEIIGIDFTPGTGYSTGVVSIFTEFQTIFSAVTITAAGFYPVRQKPVENDGSTAIAVGVPYINAGGTMSVTITSGTVNKQLTIKVLYK